MFSIQYLLLFDNMILDRCSILYIKKCSGKIYVLTLLLSMQTTSYTFIFTNIHIWNQPLYGDASSDMISNEWFMLYHIG